MDSAQSLEAIVLGVLLVAYAGLGLIFVRLALRPRRD